MTDCPLQFKSPLNCIIGQSGRTLGTLAIIAIGGEFPVGNVTEQSAHNIVC